MNVPRAAKGEDVCAAGEPRETIIVTSGSFKYNASILRAVELCRELNLRGHVTRVTLLEAEDNRDLVREAGIDDRVAWVRSRDPRDYAGAIRHSRRGLIVWHLLGATSACIYVASALRRPGDMVVSDWDEFLSRTNNGRLRRLAWYFLERRALSFSNRFVAASKYLQGQILALRPEMPCAYIPYGFRARNPTGAASGDSVVGLNGEQEYIAYMGSLAGAYREDLQQLLPMAAICQGIGLRLLVIGDGEERRSLERRMGELGLSRSCKFTGYVEQVDALLARPEIRACFLPLRDTMANRCRCPNKMFHYVAAGKAIVSNPVGEVLENLGAQGFYYSYGNVKSLGTAVQEAIGTRVEYSDKSFSWRRRCDDYLHFLAQPVTR